jgi:single-strand DNA-binding protein
MATQTSNKPAKPAAKPATDETEYGERIDGSLSGNVTLDPELRFTGTGRAVATLNVAVNERVKNEETGQWEDTEPEFFKVTVWGQQAEHAANCIQRGDRIVATGFYQDVTFTTRDGERKTTTEFTAKDIGPSLLFREVVIKRVQRNKR